MQLRNLIKDRRGTAAVEFAFVAPVMILMYYGLAELTQGMMADRRASHVAAAIGDLVAQDTVINTTEMTDVFNVGKAIIAPFPATGLSMRVTSIRKDSTGAIQVMWSKTSGSSLGVLTTVASLPTGLIASVQLPGHAQDVCTFNDVAVVALGSQGVAICNIFTTIPIIFTVVVNILAAVASIFT